MMRYFGANIDSLGTDPFRSPSRNHLYFGYFLDVAFRVATNLQFVKNKKQKPKNIVSAKHKIVKLNEMKYACTAVLS